MAMPETKKIVQWAGSPRITDSDKIQREKRLVLSFLNKIPYRHYSVIWGKIIQRKDWFSMEDECYYSERQLRTYQREGLELLKMHIDKAISKGEIDLEDLEKII